MIDIKLTNKPISEPIRYNAYYKIVVMLAIIKYMSFNKKSTINLLHLAFWSLRTDENYKVLVEFSNNVRNTLVPWSFEEGVEKILGLAFINEFCEKVITADGLEIKITTKGEEILNKIENLKLFEEDLTKIKAVKRIAKTKVSNANKNWTIL